MARFNPDNAVWDNQKYIIGIPCILCEVYKLLYSCKGCSFNKVTGIRNFGCLNWIDKRLIDRVFSIAEVRRVCWTKKNNKLARAQLKQYLKILEEEIEWV